MRLGIFGGTFDPIHFGHLLLAETCREHCQLDQIQFVPNFIPPHKRRHQHDAPSCGATAEQRVQMLRLATGGHPAFAVSTIEIDRGGISYTVDTLEEIARQQPSTTIFLLMGADSLIDLPTWRDPVRICQLAIPLVARRRGTPEPDFQVLAPYLDAARLNLIRDHAFESPMIELSSTEIRERVRTNRSIRYRTPRAVEQFIFANQLYVRPTSKGGE
jgi:nicotinate-nucleotide adenylyltransferase